ncbi:hypothetical protein Scep_000754 [Stephania cephalantha]|uniref:Cyclin-like domain-containing protein n=1 Tax=Stephania cephalantha TaxID=152367 RepID=A0AAP0Q3B4_9MAGN
MGVACPYCSSTQGRCATTSSGRFVTECCSCGRVVEERQTNLHDLFLIRAHDTPLCLVTPDLPPIPPDLNYKQVEHQPEGPEEEEKEDPFEASGFITAFSAASLEPTPLFLRSALSFSGHLAELERALDTSSSSSSGAPGSVVVVDNLRAYLQIIDVSSILGLDFDISDHAFQLFRDCSAATCLRNRSVEALATAALVQAIREAQEPRTLQEISIAANLPQKEIGKYIKILGEALQLSQPINSNSISVHMPRFCNLLQLNKSAQDEMSIENFEVLGKIASPSLLLNHLELATHIGEVVINKCFCTRRNPISISAAAIYLACQLEDKRKTQAEICKVTGLTEVTLRKVYKELLENWDDLLPPNYTPAVPPEKAFPTTIITSGRPYYSAPRVDHVETASSLDKDKQPEVGMSDKPPEAKVSSAPIVVKNVDHHVMNKASNIWHGQIPFKTPIAKATGDEKVQISSRGIDNNDVQASPSESEKKVDVNQNATSTNQKLPHISRPPASSEGSSTWPFQAPFASGSHHVHFIPMPRPVSKVHQHKGATGHQNRVSEKDLARDTGKQ